MGISLIGREALFRSIPILIAGCGGLSTSAD
jgi:hypothetical protein